MKKSGIGRSLVYIPTLSVAVPVIDDDPPTRSESIAPAKSTSARSSPFSSSRTFPGEFRCCNTFIADSVLVAADLARGTGRFDITQGVFATAQELGGAFGNFAAGFLATAFGFPATFATLAAVAGRSLLLFVFAMPETRGTAQTPAAAAA